MHLIIKTNNAYIGLQVIYRHNFSCILVADRTARAWGVAKPHVTVTVPIQDALWLLFFNLCWSPLERFPGGEPRHTPGSPSQGSSVNIDFAAGFGAQRWLSCSLGRI